METNLKKRKQVTDFNILKVVGQGTYNCAHLIRVNGKDEVLRIALLLPFEKPHVKVMVERGLHIVHVMQGYKHIIGPSLISETSPYEIVKSLSRVTYQGACETIKERILKLLQQQKVFEFALQHLEYLTGGPFHNQQTLNTLEEFDFCCFSLLWFFRTSQAVFGLRHRDLKPDNIILRKYDRPMLFTFIKRNGIQVTFKSQYVPVVIDYDFASVVSTITLVDRENVGTRETAPPSALLVELFSYLFISLPEDKKQTEEQEVSYDWWSLGINLFYVAMQPLTRYNMFTVFDDERYGFANKAAIVFCSQYGKQTEQCKDPAVQQIFKGIAYGFCIKAIVQNYVNSKDKSWFFPTNYPSAFIKLLTDMLDGSARVKSFTKLYLEKIPEHIRNVLFELLTYNTMFTRFNPEQWFQGGMHAEDTDLTFIDAEPNAKELEKLLDHEALKYKI